MIAFVLSNSFSESGVVVAIQVGENTRNVPVSIDWESSTIKSDLCNAIKADCVANGTPVSRVVLSDLYSE